MEDQKLIDLAIELTKQFLTQLGLDADVTGEVQKSVNKSEKEVSYVRVKLDGENLNELVGYHGANLEAVQTILGLMLSKKSGVREARMIIEINDYRERREKYLEAYAQRAAEEVRNSGQEMELPPMKPAERRVIHLALETEQGISTDSVGEGDDRRVIIRPA